MLQHWWRLLQETDLVFDGVAVRMYELADRSGDKLPGIVFYHGGGFVFWNVSKYTVFLLTNTMCANKQAVKSYN